MKSKPSLFKMLLNDTFAGIGVVVPLFSAFQALTWFMHEIKRGPLVFTWSEIGNLLLLLILTIAAIVIMILRIKNINLLFEDGIEIPGNVISSTLGRRGYEVRYNYIFKGQEYAASVNMGLIQLKRHIKRDRPLMLMIDPNNPQRVLICDLFRSGDDRK